MKNYFELFDLPVSFRPDLQTVKSKFYTLSRQYHPDFYGTAVEADKAKALEMSALTNKAFKIFQSPDELMKYVLQLHSLLEEEEKYNLPSDFLMEVMELNEALMDMDSNDESAQKGILEIVGRLQDEIYAPVQQIIENYQEGVTTKEELLRVKEYYYKKKYLDKIISGI